MKKHSAEAYLLSSDLCVDMFARSFLKHSLPGRYEPEPCRILSESNNTI